MTSLTAATVWMVASTALSLLMSAGYALFDIGSVRAKNSAGAIVRHLVVTASTVLFFLFMGFGLYFGGTGGFFGVLDFFTLGSYGPELVDGVSMPLFIASQTAVAVAVANIVCGALAERATIAAHIAVAAVVGLLVFPFVNRWTWGTGWLAALGFHDFAGSASLNVTAGVIALVSAALTGPRAGKYRAEGAVMALPGQSLTRCLLGVMLVFAGWFGLVGVSLPVYGVADADALGQAFLNMLLVPSVALLAAAIASQVRYGCIDVPMVLNAFVGGLVAISCGADVVHPMLGCLLGAIAGVTVVAGIEWLERVARIDDPVGAAVAHGACGLVGFVFTGLVAAGDGLVYGGASFLGVEVLGALAICTWSVAVSAAVLLITRRSLGLRVLDSEEEAGLGLTGPSLNNAYAAYLAAPGDVARGRSVAPAADLPVDAAVPLELAASAATASLNKVEIICRPPALERLRSELAAIGVTGMTVTAAEGCGDQMGARESYRGVPVDVGLVPKVRVDAVVSRVPVDEVVRAVRRALYTGHIGDGKIFIYTVAEAVKVRTGEHGADAVQSIEDQVARAAERGI